MNCGWAGGAAHPPLNRAGLPQPSCVPQLIGGAEKPSSNGGAASSAGPRTGRGSARSAPVELRPAFFQRPISGEMEQLAGRRRKGAALPLAVRGAGSGLNRQRRAGGEPGCGGAGGSEAVRGPWSPPIPLRCSPSSSGGATVCKEPPTPRCGLPRERRWPTQDLRGCRAAAAEGRIRGLRRGWSGNG